MNCTLMINNSDTNVLTKTVTEVDTVSCILKDNVSIQRPTIILATSAATLAKCNYMYIPDLGRYYYIEDTTLMTGGRWQVTGRVDVLMSFNAQIKNVLAIVDKQTKLSNASMFIDDGDFVVENRKYNTVINFPNSLLSTGEFILITAGGQGN